MQNDYNDPRWQKLRLQCMDRDKWCCVSCGDSRSMLHVHHKRYCGKIWDSQLCDLQTLCGSCHMGLGPHPKAGMWYERICDIPKKCLVADNWHQRSKEIDREAVAIAVQNCPQCGEQEFTSPAGVLNCFYCGWSIELSRYTFLHVPAKIINPKEEQARIDAAELEKKRQHAIGQLRTWARKCRERGFSDAVMWSAAFPEHAVPFGYELDSEGSLGQSVFHADEIAQLKAYLTSGMSFHDIAWELLAGFEDLRRRMIATGHAPEATHGR